MCGRGAYLKAILFLMGCLGDSLEYFKNKKNASGCFKILKNTLRYFKTFQDTLKYLKSLQKKISIIPAPPTLPHKRKSIKMKFSFPLSKSLT
jgi:hypothetical protein